MVGFRTSAVAVTIGTILFIAGLEFMIVGYIYRNASKIPEEDTLYPNGTVTYQDLTFTSFPLLCIGFPAMIFGYVLWYVKSKTGPK